MQRALLKAAGKKLKYKMHLNTNEESDSDASLTSDDEEEVSEGMIGKIIRGTYIIIKYLGRGTFSRVWLVYNLNDEKCYALKIIFSKYFDDSKYEVGIIKKIGNENNNLMKTIDIFQLDDSPEETCLVSELMGLCVLDLFNSFEETDPPLKLVKYVVRGILLGLNELHSKNLIHTDLKQENIMIDVFKNTTVKLLEYINTLKIKETLEEFVKMELPEDFSDFDKNKKKKVRRKCKLKAYKKFQMYIEENLNKFNKEIKEISYPDFNLDENYNFNVKIIDFGNCENLDNKDQDEIQIRPYRPPENIINDYYDCKSDIWTLGCIIFEIITGDYLFDIPNKKKSIERDRLHIHKMYEILGKMPREMSENCDFTEDLFDNKGRVLKNKNCNYTSISEILVKDYEYSIENAKEIEGFLKKMLEYDTKKRYSAKDLLQDPWIN